MGMVLSIVQFSATKLEEYIDNPQKFENDLGSLEKNKNDIPVYLDKSWEAVHFILTGNKIGNGEPPLSLAVYGLHFFDEGQDLGMGPACYLFPDQVKVINSILEGWDESFVKERYNPEKMDQIGIYPTFWKKDPTLIDYVSDNFKKLKRFYKDAALKGNAVASYLG
jgi:hypothetical protein